MKRSTCLLPVLLVVSLGLVPPPVGAQGRAARVAVQPVPDPAQRTAPDVAALVDAWAGMFQDYFSCSDYQSYVMAEDLLDLLDRVISGITAVGGKAPDVSAAERRLIVSETLDAFTDDARIWVASLRTGVARPRLAALYLRDLSRLRYDAVHMRFLPDLVTGSIRRVEQDGTGAHYLLPVSTWQLFAGRRRDGDRMLTLYSDATRKMFNVRLFFDDAGAYERMLIDEIVVLALADASTADVDRLIDQREARVEVVNVR